METKKSEEVSVYKEGEKWVTEFEGKVVGKNNDKHQAKRIADYLIFSKKHPDWSVTQIFNHIDDQERIKSRN